MTDPMGESDASESNGRTNGGAGAQEERGAPRGGGGKQIEIGIGIGIEIEAGPAPKSRVPRLHVLSPSVLCACPFFLAIICVVAQHHHPCSHAAMFTAVILICLSISVDLVLYPVGYVGLVRARASRTTLNSQGMAKTQKKRKSQNILRGIATWHGDYSLITPRSHANFSRCQHFCASVCLLVIK